MSKLDILITELETDPLIRGYSGMSDDEASDSLSVVDRTLPVDTVDGGAILNATDDTEFSVLTVPEQDQWLGLCGVDGIDVSNGVAKAIEANLFGGGTATRANLGALKTRAVSRGVEIGFGTVAAGHVEEARR